MPAVQPTWRTKLLHKVYFIHARHASPKWSHRCQLPGYLSPVCTSSEFVAVQSSAKPSPPAPPSDHSDEY